MRIAVITCYAFRDTWTPFRLLFQKFWPACPYPWEFYSDDHGERFGFGESWCSVVARCAKDAGNDAILLLLDDYFLTAPVQQHLVEHGLKQLGEMNAGCVRLYPMPGGVEWYGDPYFKLVPHGSPNRISCQAAIWNPHYLYKVAMGSTTTTSEAGDFENLGSPFAESLTEPVLAFDRQTHPWPMDYLCSAISRGKWEPAAIDLCKLHEITLDRSMREVAS